MDEDLENFLKNIRKIKNNDNDFITEHNRFYGTLTHFLVYLRRLDLLKKIDLENIPDQNGLSPVELSKILNFNEIYYFLTNQPESIIKEGMLKKYTNVIEGFKLRYILLTHSKFKYYKISDKKRVLRDTINTSDLYSKLFQNKLKVYDKRRHICYIFKGKRSQIRGWHNTIKSSMIKESYYENYLNNFLTLVLYKLADQNQKNILMNFIGVNHYIKKLYEYIQNRMMLTEGSKYEIKNSKDDNKILHIKNGRELDSIKNMEGTFNNKKLYFYENKMDSKINTIVEEIKNFNLHDNTVMEENNFKEFEICSEENHNQSSEFEEFLTPPEDSENEYLPLNYEIEADLNETMDLENNKNIPKTVDLIVGSTEGDIESSTGEYEMNSKYDESIENPGSNIEIETIDMFGNSADYPFSEDTHLEMNNNENLNKYLEINQIIKILEYHRLLEISDKLTESVIIMKIVTFIIKCTEMIQKYPDNIKNLNKRIYNMRFLIEEVSLNPQKLCIFTQNDYFSFFCEIKNKIEIKYRLLVKKINSQFTWKIDLNDSESDNQRKLKIYEEKERIIKRENDIKIIKNSNTFDLIIPSKESKFEYKNKEFIVIKNESNEIEFIFQNKKYTFDIKDNSILKNTFINENTDDEFNNGNFYEQNNEWKCIYEY